MRQDDNTQQPPNDRSFSPIGWPRAWRRWLGGTIRSPTPAPPADPATAEMLSVHATLRALPTLIDGSSLPNGVVELLIDDFEEPTRQLFDIHDGAIAHVEPGTAMPWACIAGTLAAWALALGPERNIAELQLTGDEQLARRVLAALAHHDQSAH
ncbi:MAG: hypothetical protein WBQ21_01545 [Solirubrobacteraceae bacterium]